MLAFAQAETEAGSETTTAPPPKTLGDADVIYLKDEKGDLHPVPIDKTFEQWVEYLDRSVDQSNLPGIICQEMTLEGEIVESELNGSWLKFTLTAQLSNRAETWTSFPLQCKEAVITSVKPQGNSRVLIDRDPQTQQWNIWLRKIDSLTVQLQGQVRLEKTGNRSTFQLSVPKAIRTAARIRLPQKNLQVIPIQGLVSQQQETQSETIVDLIGITSHVELEWEQAKDARTALESTAVKTLVQLEVLENRVQINANQTITPQSSLRQLSVRIPPGFDLMSVVSEGLLNQTIDSSNPSLITLDYKEPFRTPKTIQWILSAELRRNQDQINLNGFDVVGSKSQSGQIGLTESAEWQLKTMESRSRGIVRMNANDVKQTETYTSRYQFDQQPFRMTLQITPIEPQYHAATEYQLQVEDATEEIQLTAQYTIDLEQGQLRELPIYWPELNENNWLIASMTINNAPSASRWKRTKAGFSIPLADDLAYPLLIEVRALHPRADVEQNLAFSLPVPEGSSNPLQGSLTLTDRGPVESSLQFREPEEWTTGQRLESLKGSTLIHEQKFRFRSLADSALQLTSQKQQQILTANTTVTIATEQVDQGELLVSQKIGLKAEYVPLSTLHLILPAEAQFPSKYGSRVGIRTSTGKPLPGNRNEDSEIVLLASDWSTNVNDRWETEFTIQYAVAIEDIEKSESLELPLVVMRDTEFQSSTFLQSLQKRWRVNSSNWHRQFDDPIQTSWKSNVTAASIPITAVSTEQAVPSSRPIASQGLLTLLKYPDGQWVCQLDCQFFESPQELMIQWPAAVQQVTSQWSTATQSDQLHTWTKQEFDQTGLQLKPPIDFSTNDPATLSLRWSVPNSSSSLMSILQASEPLALPSIDGIWWQSLDCLTQLPQGQVLASSSKTVQPIDDWSFRGWYWSRSIPASRLKNQVAWNVPSVINSSGRIYRFHLGKLPKALPLNTQSITAMTLSGLAIGLLLVTGMVQLWENFHRYAVLAAGITCLVIGSFLPETLSQWGQPVVAGMVLGGWLEWLRQQHYRPSPATPSVVVIDRSESVIQITTQPSSSASMDSVTTIQPVMQATSSVVTSEDEP